MSKPNELRQAIFNASKRRLQHQGLGGKTHEHPTDFQIDAILDAAIEALPTPTSQPTTFTGQTTRQA